MSDLDDVAGYKDGSTGTREQAPPADGAAQIQAASAPELRTLVGIAVGTLVIAALYFGQEVLIPITLAIMLSFVLSPVVNMLQKLRLWRAPAVILTVLAALGVLGMVGTLIGSQAASLTANAPGYARTIEAKMQGVQGFAVGHLASITKQLSGGKPATAGGRGTPAPVMTAVQPAVAGARKAIPVQVVQEGSSPLAALSEVMHRLVTGGGVGRSDAPPSQTA